MAAMILSKSVVLGFQTSTSRRTGSRSASSSLRPTYVYMGNELPVSASVSASASESDGQPEKSTSKDDRRQFLAKGVSAATALATSASIPALPAVAADARSNSRSEGYSVQHSDREWSYLLSGSQYNILRQGGTERPYSSILESEERPGTYKCAGCATDLFSAADKFHSGTGWPSYAAGTENVQVAPVNPVLMTLGGAEIRCGKCGGHLGDIFLDGKLYVGTRAFETGKRFCVDGAALVFQPSEAGQDPVFGDTPPAPAKPSKWAQLLDPPKINPV